MGVARTGGPIEAGLLAALQDVRDPEWPVSIVDLGLVRSLERHGSRVKVALTFTNLACPCVHLIIGDVKARLGREPGVEEVEVDVTWEGWSPEDMSEAARRRFREWGVTA